MVKDLLSQAIANERQIDVLLQQRDDLYRAAAALDIQLRKPQSQGTPLNKQLDACKARIMKYSTRNWKVRGDYSASISNPLVPQAFDELISEGKLETYLGKSKTKKPRYYRLTKAQ